MPPSSLRVRAREQRHLSPHLFAGKGQQLSSLRVDRFTCVVEQHDAIVRGGESADSGQLALQLIKRVEQIRGREPPPLVSLDEMRKETRHPDRVLKHERQASGAVALALKLSTEASD